ncbi:MAG: HPF/RaiA family ribosome-associated protein [Azoarcus sp.]|jgi:ribosome-associated translation inhibitor RaiA|nr:HPF/RaiA family ribosome-associated protein [Azoarcus sp.]
MQIVLRCGERETESLRDYIAQQMNAAIARFRAHIRWARVKVADANETDKRCVVQLRLRNLPDVMFAITHLDVRAAVDKAAAQAAWMLTRRLRRGLEHAALGHGLSRRPVLLPG